MKILGKLIIIEVDKEVLPADLDKNASNNLNFFETGILKRIISESKHKENSRRSITTASNIPKEIGPICKGL
jgi:cyanophycinase